RRPRRRGHTEPVEHRPRGWVGSELGDARVADGSPDRRCAPWDGHVGKDLADPPSNRLQLPFVADMEDDAEAVLAQPKELIAVLELRLDARACICGDPFGGELAGGEP